MIKFNKKIIYTIIFATTSITSNTCWQNIKSCITSICCFNHCCENENSTSNIRNFTDINIITIPTTPTQSNNDANIASQNPNYQILALDRVPESEQNSEFTNLRSTVVLSVKSSFNSGKNTEAAKNSLISTMPGNVVEFNIFTANFFATFDSADQSDINQEENYLPQPLNNDIHREAHGALFRAINVPVTYDSFRINTLSEESTHHVLPHQVPSNENDEE